MFCVVIIKIFCIVEISFYQIIIKAPPLELTLFFTNKTSNVITCCFNPIED